MADIDSTNSTYCPHIRLFGANILTSGDNDKDTVEAEQVSSSIDDSMSTTDSQSTLSLASIPIADSSAIPELNGTPNCGTGTIEEPMETEETGDNMLVKDEAEPSASPGGDGQDDLTTEVDDTVKTVPDTLLQRELCDVSQPKKMVRTKRRPTCGQCKSKSNLWKCLGLDCGLLMCGARANDHAGTHFQENPEHFVQENVSSKKLWCNVCNREVFRDYRNRRAVPAIWFPRDDGDESPPRGLYNIGNTCYMNAALQNIAAIAPLTSYLMGDTFHDDETRPRRVFGSYRMFLTELFSHANTSYMSAVMPSRLLYAVRLAHPMFRGFHQHDSQEFLRLIMDTLATETKVPHFSFVESSTSNPSENQDCEHESDTESFETADSGNGSEGTVSTNGTNTNPLKLSDHVSSKVLEEVEVSSSTTAYPSVKVTMKSILDDVCNGQLESSVQCLSCHETSRRLEIFQDLSLPIPAREELAALHQREERYLEEGDEPLGWYEWTVDWLKWLIWGPAPTLNECLAAFFSSDELKGKNMYSCEKCKTLRNGLKRCSLYHLPEVLCVHLKRFRMVESSPGASPHKINKFVKFPLDDLDVRQFLHPDCSDRVTNYRLMGIICHHGSVGVGHYTAYIRKRDTWYITDDCRVSEVTSEEVENCEAYVLFYNKWDTEQEEDEVKRKLLATWAKCDTTPESIVKFHLISRKWLTQYMWGEEEMGLDNSDVVCPHGRLAPVENLEMSATWVPDVVWEAIVDRYGGGPDLESPEFCQVCAIAWKKYQRTNSQQRMTSGGTTYSSRSYSYSFSSDPALLQFLSPKREPPRRRLGSGDSTSENTGTATCGTLPEWQ